MELYTADKKEQVGRCYLCEDNIPRNSIQFESPVASSSAKDEIVTTIHLPSVANESLSKPEAKCSSLSVDIESNSDSQIPKFRHSPNIEDYSTISTINEISYSTGFGEMSDCGNAENNYLMENINNIVIQQDSINGDTLIVCDLAADSQETHGSSLKEPDATDSFVHKISVKNYSLNLRYGNVFYDIEQSKGEIFYIKNENLFNSSGDSNEFPTTLPREAPPPTYRSLIEQILEDSPPSYEDVTGNKVRMYFILRINLELHLVGKIYILHQLHLFIIIKKTIKFLMKKNLERSSYELLRILQDLSKNFY